MIVGVFSDVHDNIAALNSVLDDFKGRNVTRAIFCGDFCSPIPSRVMGESGLAIDCVFGNGDGDRVAIHRFASTDFPNLTLHGEHAELGIDDRKFAVTHYPLYAQALARTGDYDAVFSGHTHEVHEEAFDDCLWVNPGEVFGVKGAPSYAFYDTGDNTVSISRL
jgi:putative phosphoesterase